jgi:hypothetical protein
VLIGPALADVDLHEGAHFLRQFPRRGALAGGQADDHRTDLARLAGLQCDLFGNIVALVEQADGRHAVLHRGRAVIGGLGLRCGGSSGGRRGRIERDALGLRLAGAVTGGKSQSAGQRRG